MKFKIQFKDPDGVYESIKDAVEDSLAGVGHDLNEQELEDLMFTREERTGTDLKKWIKNGEYVTVEFDTEAGTAVVVPS